MTALELVYAYHQQSKHHLNGYAPGPGGLDWANQPDPFRVFTGAPGIDLRLAADAETALFSGIRGGERPHPAPVDLAHLAVLLELSFGLSAWKSYGDARWALRCNPSSGNLHPTECYLITDARAGLAGGIYHYVSRDHRLEQRALDLETAAAGPPTAGLVLALSSIYWREAWKYGLRAFRYCQHDLGHAIAAVAYAAAVLGWQVTRLPWGDAVLAGLLGLDRADEFPPGHQEAADVALWVGPAVPPAAELTRLRQQPRRFQGRANLLSRDYRHWSGIATVHEAAERPEAALPVATQHPSLPPPAANPCTLTAADLIRQRRSAQEFDGATPLSAQRWFAMLDALLPRAGVPPLDAWNGPPRVHLALFVHRVEGIAPGLYCLARDPAAIHALRSGLGKAWRWEPLEAAPAHLPLFCLVQGDARAAARQLACHQDIAADSAFAVGMLADFDAALADGPWHYRELFWECGLIGQILYLEAEAAGLRGTGIGCFFDDAVHDLLGIADTRWQSLYHFTVGGPLEDQRLQTEPPYAHLETRAS